MQGNQEVQDEIRNTLVILSREYPTLRFLQLIGNIVPEDKSMYYMEDEEFLRMLKDYQSYGFVVCNETLTGDDNAPRCVRPTGHPGWHDSGAKIEERTEHRDPSDIDLTNKEFGV